MKTPVTIAGAKVITSGSYTLLSTDFGLQVKFDGIHHLEITVPGKYFNRVSWRNPILLSVHQTSLCCVRQLKTDVFLSFMPF